eukprot:4927360-Amphidinium_carterae.2
MEMSVSSNSRVALSLYYDCSSSCQPSCRMGDHREHLNVKAVELIETAPNTRFGQKMAAPWLKNRPKR